MSPYPLPNSNIPDRECLGFADGGRFGSHTLFGPSPTQNWLQAVSSATEWGKKMNTVEMFVLYSKQTAENKYTGHRSSPGQQLLWKETDFLSLPEQRRDLMLQSQKH